MHGLKTHLPLLAAVLSGTVCAVAFVAWGGINGWQVVGISTYDLFPLFGLLAFSLLWSLYVAAAAQQYLKADSPALENYFVVAGYFVLLTILLHPSLLVFQLWRDGFGLPPGSYLENYVAPNLGWAATLGAAAFAAFMAYELRRLVKSDRWKTWMVYPSDIAMLAVLIHGLQLGGELQTGWFHTVWWFYGAAYAGCVFYLRLWPRLQAKLKSSG